MNRGEKPDLKKYPSEESQKALGALSVITEALQKGKIRFGACKTRGFGKVKFEEDKFHVDYYDFGKQEDLDRWLKGENQSERNFPNFSQRLELKENGERYTIEVEWEPTSSLMVKSGRDGIDTDMLPLLSANGSGLVPVIPGSSLKGVLRAQAEKILRTIFDPNSVSDDEPCLDIVKELFGTEESAGRLAVDDVYCKSTALDTEKWMSEDKEALNQFSVKQYHVAIDRFTGGASEGALYSARPVKPDMEWNPICLTLDFSDRGGITLDETRRNQMLALVKLLLRDLKDGWIPVGFGSRRGMGEIEITSVNGAEILQGGNLQNNWEKFIDGNGKFERALPKAEVKN